MWPVSWAPDGTSILYVTNGRETSNDIWVLPLDGGMPYPFQQTPASENWAAFSPDGKWVAYSSTASSDIPEVFVTRFPGRGPSWRISADGGSQARWRRDGTEIFYLAPDRRLMAATVAERDGAMAVTRVDPLFTLTFPYGAYHAFDVSADGARFLVNTVLGANAPTQQVGAAARQEAARMIERLTGRKEWMFFAALPQADGTLAIAWWAAVVLRGVLPAVFAIAMGALVVAVQRGDDLTPSLAVVGAAFVLLQVLTPIQTAISLNLGDRTAAFLYDRLTAACVRPAGMGHLEDPSLTADMTAARDFDLGMTGPPLSYSMDFIAGGLVGHADRPDGRGGAGRIRLVGAARARRRLAVDALAAARERRLARSQDRRSARRAT